ASLPRDWSSDVCASVLISRGMDVSATSASSDPTGTHGIGGRVVGGLVSAGWLDAEVADASIPLDIDAKQGRSLDAGSSRRLGVDRSHLIAPAGASRSDDRTSGGRIRGARRDGRSSRAIDTALLRLARGPGVGRWTGTGRAAR